MLLGKWLEYISSYEVQMALVCCLYHAAHHLATACAPLHHLYFWSGDWNM